jgi:hypothetical protein
VRAVDLQVVRHLLFTKYIDWRHEQGVRVFISLEDKDPQRAFYFADDCVLQRCPPLRIAEPAVFGVRKPVLLLPEGIMDRLTPAQLDAVLGHEMCHVRRRCASSTISGESYCSARLDWWPLVGREQLPICSAVPSGTLNDPAAFINGNDLVSGNIVQNLMLTGWPINLD